MGKWKALQVLFSLVIVAAMIAMVIFSPSLYMRAVSAMEDGIYDLRLRYTYKPLKKDTPIAIIDVNDASLEAEGRWPWPREKLADLVKQLFAHGANVIAFDFVFPEPEKNIVEEVISNLKTSSNSSAIQELEQIQSQYDYDQQFAQNLAAGSCSLGFVLKNDNIHEGALPAPSLELSDTQAQQLFITNMSGYLGNIDVLQKAAKGGGFLNASPDADGICRTAPILMRIEKDVYLSLATSAASLYLLSSKLQFLVDKFNATSILQGLQIDQIKIPTDPWGKALVPFRGPPYTFSYIPATNVLKGNVRSEEIANKLIFIGSTASALGDLYATSISPSFPGVEIHASIAAGILDNQFPFRPDWEIGATTTTILIVGLLASLIFPFLSPGKVIISFIVILLALVSGNYIIWTRYSAVLPIVPPLFTLIFLFVVDLATGFFSETLQKRKIRSIFNQYLPASRIEQILTQKSTSLEGESKELTVLFSDIRSFTTLTEKMMAKELKLFLSLIFTRVTGIIFKHKGTIDKYVGDMVMAFWGAPLDDPNHAKNGVITAYEIQQSLTDLNQELVKQNLPPIKLGVGLNTGQMNVGDMGSEYRLSYTVLGDSVNLASRLESLTKYYHVNIMVGELTQEETKNDFLYRKLDYVRVKGKDTPQRIYELVCPIDQATPELRENIRKHEEALELYSKGNFTQAKAAFTALKSSDEKNSPLYQLYIDRIDGYITTPPTDWQGIYSFDTK